MAVFVKSLIVTVLLAISFPWSESTSVSIVLSSADENVTARSTVLLVCVAYGNPAPSITWLFMGGSIHNSSLRHTVYTSPSFSSGLNFTESILEICNIGINEGGQYICNASNGIDDVTNTTTLTVLESGEPNVPCNCSSKPVYSSDGDLSFVEFSWTQVDNPPAVIAGVNPNITDYHISVDGFGTHSIPAVSVCPPGSNSATNTNIICTYSYPVRSLNPPRDRIDGHVAARNEIGIGRKCSPLQNIVGQMNSYMRLSLETTNDVVKIECLPSPDSSLQRSFECNFCYNSDSTCQSKSGDGKNWICHDLTGREVSLPSLTEGTYCYRATAIIDGTSAAVVQDTFIITSQGGFNSMVSDLSVSISVSAIIAFAIGLLVGFLTCLCYIRLHKRSRGISNDYATAMDDKDTPRIYDMISMDPMEAKGKEMDITKNSAYGKLSGTKF